MSANCFLVQAWLESRFPSVSVMDTPSRLRSVGGWSRPTHPARPPRSCLPLSERAPWHVGMTEADGKPKVGSRELSTSIRCNKLQSVGRFQIRSIYRALLRAITRK